MPELSDLPGQGPATLVGVKVAMKLTDTDDDARLNALVAAVNPLVRSWRCSEAAQGKTEWPGNITEGANMLVVRLYRRKQSPAGVEAIGEAGAVYVMRSDPDVAMLLGLGSWSAPGLG